MSIYKNSEFLRESASKHAQSFREHEFEIVEQLHFGRATDAPKSSGRTFWHLKHASLGHAFGKVNFGFRLHGAASTLMLKEVETARFMKSQLSAGCNFVIPAILDHWTEEFAEFAVMEWFDLQTVGLLNCLQRPTTYRDWCSMMDWFRGIQIPTWWDEKKHIWINYARVAGSDLSKVPLSPFAVDFDNNLGISTDGDLVIFDFEHMQWAERGLLDCFIALKYIALSDRQFALQFIGKGLLNQWWRGVRQDVDIDRKLIDRADSILTEFVEKHGRISLGARMKMAFCARLWA